MDRSVATLCLLLACLHVHVDAPRHQVCLRLPAAAPACTGRLDRFAPLAAALAPPLRVSWATPPPGQLRGRRCIGR